MSVFEAETKQQENQSQPGENQEQNQESWIKRLVEERGEKWSDPEVIAKGKYEADKYISDLERQLAEAREDISKQDYAKTLLETLQGKKAEDASTSTPEAKEASTAEQNTTEEASIESLVEEAIRKREQDQTVSQNLKQVDETLEKAYGTEAGKIVQERASELGMSLDRLKEIASESPTAFMRLIGQEAGEKAPRAPSSSVNTQSNAFHSSGEKNWNFYQDMRRKDPKQYYSPKVQRELMENRTRLGDRFYNN